MSGTANRKAASPAQPYVIGVSLALLLVGVAGYALESRNQAPRPDGVGFGVPWDHRLHADLPDYSCLQCHHDAEPGQTEMAACDTCHLRVPGRAPGEPLANRISVQFPSLDEHELETHTRTLEAADDQVARVAVTDDSALLVDVLVVIESPVDAVRELLSARDDVRVRAIPDQRNALHATCIGCHNAVGQPTDCAACHTGVSGTAQCGTCHEAEHEQVLGGGHRNLGCATCHVEGAAHDQRTPDAPRGVHAGPVSSASTREDCASCHAPSAGDPAGPPGHRFAPDSIPETVDARQAHVPH